MQHHDEAARTRHELATILARVLYRILTPQKLPHSGNDDLDVMPEEVLSVTKPVNTTGTHGEPR